MCVFVIELKPPSVINAFKLGPGPFECSGTAGNANTQSAYVGAHVAGSASELSGGPAAPLTKEEGQDDISDRHSITHDALRPWDHKAERHADCSWHGGTYCGTMQERTTKGII